MDDIHPVLTRGNIVKRVNLLWIDGRVVHNPTNYPNPAHVESSCRGKTRMDFVKPTQRFGSCRIGRRMR
jgi:hypothetical protein